MTSFDARAATWDEDPHRRALAQAIVAAIAATVPLPPDGRLLDLGCGTGLIGLPLATGMRAALGVDTSPGMVERFTAKAAAAGLAGVRGEVRDLLADPLPPASVEVAVSAMTFHHLPEPEPMLAALAACLVPGGWVAVADLVTEDGSFHDGPVPHRGFDPERFAGLLAGAGLAEARIQEVHRLHRPDRGRDYAVFLATARRPLSAGPCAR